DTKMSEESEYLLACQIANAGQIILSKTQEATKEDVENTIYYLNKIMEKFKCKRRFEREKDIICKNWDNLSEEDFDMISNRGYISEDYAKLWFDQRKTFSSLYFMNLRMEEEKLYSVVEKIMQDSVCGNIFRIKGFMKLKDDSWIELNATHKKISIKPALSGQEVMIVIGEELNESEIRSYFNQ
ncbi:MAG: GTP-binding protein, partial [Lachnospiraceae bacterium]